MLDTNDMNFSAGDEEKRQCDDRSTPSITKFGLKEEISKLVVRKKLAKQRHLVIAKGIQPEYLDSLFPDLLSHFDPQLVNVSVACDTIFSSFAKNLSLGLSSFVNARNRWPLVQRWYRKGEGMEDQLLLGSHARRHPVYQS